MSLGFRSGPPEDAPSQKGNATPTGETRRGSRRARKVDRRLGSGCVGSAAVGSEFWLVKVSGAGHCDGQGQFPAWTRGLSAVGGGARWTQKVTGQRAGCLLTRLNAKSKKTSPTPHLKPYNPLQLTQLDALFHTKPYQLTRHSPRIRIPLTLTLTTNLRPS